MDSPPIGPWPRAVARPRLANMIDNVMSATGLVTLPDTAHFLAAYLAIALVPGYAMAALARPRSDWIERLALAIPCAYTLVAVSGLATALLHLPFGLPAYAALALPITVAGAWVMWRKLATARGPRL